MSMKPLEFDRRYGELDIVVSAFAGQEPGDPETDTAPSALQAYIRHTRHTRHTWHTRPWELSVAEQQLREYARNPPGRLRQRLGEFYPVPDLGLSESHTQSWLSRTADHIKRSIESGDVPPPTSPQTHWEWHARFGELAQFLGGWFSQDMPEDFADHDAAVRDYGETVDPQLTARLVGEIHELLALGLEDHDYAVGVGELGMEVEPPAEFTVDSWLRAVAECLATTVPDYGK
ncbi:contact-dependent growth inhibition system immunity protein [Streptomyces sp. NBC_01422]|uniref:contact-dependent growth inhibition system immunity protein n=1 Tax=Streptomyces sp. NBC_01422 TaxID=2903859 RepID=UPI002E29A648|nr:contact-dependent growth inhibition system immunity protein [Streptomyces sp. NBC_01422]